MLYSWIRRSPKIIFLLWIPALMLCRPDVTWKAVTFIPRHVRCSDHPRPLVESTQPIKINSNQFRGYVRGMKAVADGCVDVLFEKDDRTIVNFHVWRGQRYDGWPPLWVGMYGNVNLELNPICGYSVTSSQQLH
jgi:hypothetical protein